MINNEILTSVECIACFDKFILEYFIDGAFVHVEKTKPITINVKYLNFIDEHQQQKWYDKNIYSLPLYKKFIEESL